jgi:arylsulfatase A-like enzyme
VEPTRLLRLDERRATWIGRLREAGYRTVGLQKNPFLGRGSGFELSFDLYRSVGGDRAEGRSAAQLVEAALRWAEIFSEQRSAGLEAPFALYLHFMDPHIDYRAPSGWTPLGLQTEVRAEQRAATTPLDGSARSLHDRLAVGPPLSAEEREQLRRLYAAEVAYLDHQIGRLLSGLEARSLLGASTLLVVSSDHGEQFGEHGGWEHGDLYVENIRVPWIMAGAGLDPARVPDPVSMLDLGPTVLDLLGLEPLTGVEGRSRLGLARGEAGATAPGPVVTEYGRAIRWLEPPWVLIEHPSGRVELFDADADPQERADRAEHHPGVVAAMRERVAAWRGRDPEASPAGLRGIDVETHQALRELGYVW